jgi:hypothetical protein
MNTAYSLQMFTLLLKVKKTSLFYLYPVVVVRKRITNQARAIATGRYFTQHQPTGNGAHSDQRNLTFEFFLRQIKPGRGHFLSRAAS